MGFGVRTAKMLTATQSSGLDYMYMYTTVHVTNMPYTFSFCVTCFSDVIMFPHQRTLVFIHSIFRSIGENQGGRGRRVGDSFLEFLPLLSLVCYKVQEPTTAHILQEKEDAMCGSLIVVKQSHHMGTTPLNMQVHRCLSRTYTNVCNLHVHVQYMYKHTM